MQSAAMRWGHLPLAGASGAREPRLDVAERLDDVLRRPGARLPVCRSRPKIGAVRVLQRDRGLPDRRGHLVDLGVAQRCYLVEQPGEVVLQAARITTRESPSDNGFDELRMLQRG